MQYVLGRAWKLLTKYSQRVEFRAVYVVIQAVGAPRSPKIDKRQAAAARQFLMFSANSSPPSEARSPPFPRRGGARKQIQAQP
jgi:hypothetical protein